MGEPLEGRVGLLGDVHGEEVLLEKALIELSRAGATQILCTGDIADGMGSIDRCCKLLQEFGVLAVRGNHDRWLTANQMRDLPNATRAETIERGSLRYIEELPLKRRFESCLGGVLLCHGLGCNDMAKVSADDFGYALESNDELRGLIVNPDVQIVLNGHTHQPLLRHFDGLTLVNGGTLFRDHDPGYVVLDFVSGAVVWYPLGGGPTARELGNLVG